jgi:hypothetical protein
MWKYGTKLTINLLAGTGGAKNKREPGGSQNERESGINECVLLIRKFGNGKTIRMFYEASKKSPR